MLTMRLLTGLRCAGKTHKAIQRAKTSGKRFGVLTPNEPHARELRETYDVEAVSARMVHGHHEWQIVIVDDAHRIRLEDFRWIVKHAKNADGMFLTSPPVGHTGAPWLELLVELGAVQVERIYAPRRKDLLTIQNAAGGDRPSEE